MRWTSILILVAACGAAPEEPVADEVTAGAEPVAAGGVCDAQLQACKDACWADAEPEETHGPQECADNCELEPYLRCQNGIPDAIAIRFAFGAGDTRYVIDSRTGAGEPATSDELLPGTRGHVLSRRDNPASQVTLFALQVAEPICRGTTGEAIELSFPCETGNDYIARTIEVRNVTDCGFIAGTATLAFDGHLQLDLVERTTGDPAAAAVALAAINEYRTRNHQGDPISATPTVSGYGDVSLVRVGEYWSLVLNGSQLRHLRAHDDSDDAGLSVLRFEDRMLFVFFDGGHYPYPTQIVEVFPEHGYSSLLSFDSLEEGSCNASQG